MLTELRVSHFALIEQLHLSFPAGFVALTGETGAGKSLLVDAIALLLGARATGDQIRAGAEEAELEAAFTIPEGSPVLAPLRQADLLGANNCDLVVRRILSRSGRSRAYLNGRLVSVQELERCAGLLVDIHGQHEQQSLLATHAQLDALDGFARLGSLRERYAKAFARWAAAQSKLAEAVEQSRLLQEREDLLRYQWQELRDAAVQAGEDVLLRDRCQRLAHAERLRSLAEDAYERLYAGEGALTSQLGVVARQLKELATIDRQAESWCEELDQTAMALREVSGQLRDYRDLVADDPAGLDACEGRLALLERLKKKYGGTIEAVLEKSAELEQQVLRLDQTEDRLGMLRAAEADALRDAEQLAQELSTKRRQTAAKFEVALRKEFEALQLGTARLIVEIIQGEAGGAALSPRGRDQVQFLFSANKGETLHPLARVASGGEISRVMLALKSVLAGHDTVPVLVFDEVDAGVGGSAATAIGQRLRALAAYHQVLCVTHLPQVASQAQTQILVEKKAQQQRTVTLAKRLDRTSREEAIAKMLGGQAVTPAMRKAAAELLKASNPPGSA